MSRTTLYKLIVTGCVGLLLVPVIVMAQELPKTSHDGLVLQEDARAMVVYVKPGATLAPYNRIKLLNCYVAFAKDWQKDYNRQAMSPSRRVSDDDMERIKTELAGEFRKVFTKELQDKGDYQIVDEIAGDVLIVRPAIIDLMITAPESVAPGMSHTLVRSAGQMTLYAELFDGPTGEIIARVVDPRADQGNSGMLANQATNRAEADRILRRWADLLRDSLDQFHRPEQPAG